jgi:hypothetical protein
MKINITKRDVRVFFLGILTVLFLELVFNREAVKESYKAGYEEATK